MSIPALPSPPAVTSLPLPHLDSYPGQPREYARALMERKDAIEAEMDALKDVLASHSATTSTSLIDPEGYPRGDIDVCAIRHARASLARLYTDRSTVSNLLSEALNAAFAPGPSSHGDASALVPRAQLPNGMATPATLSVSNGTASHADEWPDRPIAKVNSVAPGSPASSAGLQVNDFIHAFADVSLPSGTLQSIGTLVSQSEGVALPLKIMREGRKVSLVITPRNGWGGRGLLGCHILPA